MCVIRLKNLLRGVGSVLEVCPRTTSRKRRVRVLQARRALNRSDEQNLDSEQLQGDWQRVGEQLKRAMRVYDQE